MQEFVYFSKSTKKINLVIQNFYWGEKREINPISIKQILPHDNLLQPQQTNQKQELFSHNLWSKVNCLEILNTLMLCRQINYRIGKTWTWILGPKDSQQSSILISRVQRRFSYCHSPTQVASDIVIGWPTHPPTSHHHHTNFQGTHEADFQYATLFWPH